MAIYGRPKRGWGHVINIKVSNANTNQYHSTLHFTEYVLSYQFSEFFDLLSRMRICKVGHNSKCEIAIKKNTPLDISVCNIG